MLQGHGELVADGLLAELELLGRLGWGQFVEQAAMHDDSPVWIIMGIEYERFERIVGIALRRRYHVDNGFIERIDTFPRLRGDKARGIRIQSEIMVYLVQA